MRMDLYPHQEKALNELHNGQVLWGGVGTGKSRVAAYYYRLREETRDVIVITTAKKRDSLDWEKEFAHLHIGREVSRYGLLTVDSWNNIGKYTDKKDCFFIFDEQRLVGTGAWAQAFIKIARHNRWILLSATPGDTWMDYVPVFIANGFFRNRTEFKREHVVYNTFTKFPKVDRYIGVGKLVRLRNSLLVEMPYMRHTTRVEKTIKVDYDVELLDKVAIKRWHVFENRPLRDVAELFSVMRKVVNSDSSRVKAIEALLQKHPKLIVFYNFDYELELLRSLTTSSDFQTPTISASGTESQKQSTLFPGNGGSSHTPIVAGSSSSSTPGKVQPSFALAEWNGHKHEAIPKTDSWLYLVQYTAGSEGWNCTETDAMCFYSLTYSYKAFHQAHGRIDRLNTPFRELYYYILKSGAAIDTAVKKSLDEKKSFQEKDNVRFVMT